MAENILAKPNILRLKPYEPGKPIEEVEREFGIRDVIKMASNENPLGPSPKALEAIENYLKNISLYPDGNCFYLKKDLAQHLDFPEENIMLGNGSDELIHFIGLVFLNSGDEVITSQVSFVRYEAAAILNDSKCIMVPLKNLAYDLEKMAEVVNERTKLIFIANPNNPTGTMVTQKEVEKFMDKVPERAVVVFDEAYYEYVEDSEFPRTLEYVREGRNVIVLRTFSKIYGLAGLRIGYGIAKKEFVDYINQVREPFNVNSLAQVAARAALIDVEHVERSRKVNSEGKKYLYKKFEELGLSYAPSEANFIFVNLGRDSREVFRKLLPKGIIIRTGDIFDLPEYARVTIGTQEQNERFIQALQTVLKEDD